jgi:aspartate racemase
MKCVGIVGGIAPESTVDYYRRIIALHAERAGSNPRIIINSIDMVPMVGHVAAGRREALVDLLVEEVAALARAGADFAVLSSNTPHIAFDDLRPRAPLPMISIVEAAADAAAARSIKRAGLFGSGFTMRSTFYAETFARRGVTVVVPSEGEQQTIHAKYVGELVDGRYTGELVNGVFLPETRKAFAAIASRMRDEEGIEALILGGTELPLLLRDESEAGMPLLDTTGIHVARIVDQLLS